MVLRGVSITWIKKLPLTLILYLSMTCQGLACLSGTHTTPEFFGQVYYSLSIFFDIYQIILVRFII
ncbi:hypothetical protein AT1219_20026 [Vibrio alginolyticus]